MSQKNVYKPKPKESAEKKTGFGGVQKLSGGKVHQAVKRVFDTYKNIFSGDIIEKQESTSFLNLLIWLTLLGFVYITNNYWAEQKIREINRREKALKEMRYQYISTKSKLMTMSRQSEVLKRLEPIGYKENKEPLKVIRINKNELDQMRK